MPDKCISGRHDYEHLGYTCDEVDEQLRVARDIALRGGTSLVSDRGPVWSSDGEDLPVPDSIDANGSGVYRSGHLGPARGDDAVGKDD